MVLRQRKWSLCLAGWEFGVENVSVGFDWFGFQC